MARTITETIRGTPGFIINDGAGNIGFAPSVVTYNPTTGYPSGMTGAARTVTETIRGTPGIIINDGAGKIGTIPMAVLYDGPTGLPFA